MSGFRVEVIQGTVSDSAAGDFAEIVPAPPPRHRFIIAKVVIENLAPETHKVWVNITTVLSAVDSENDPPDATKFHVGMPPGEISILGLSTYTWDGPFVMVPGQRLALYTKTAPFTVDPKYHVELAIEEIEEDAA